MARLLVTNDRGFPIVEIHEDDESVETTYEPECLVAGCTASFSGEDTVADAIQTARIHATAH